MQEKKARRDMNRHRSRDIRCTETRPSTYAIGGNISPKMREAMPGFRSMMLRQSIRLQPRETSDGRRSKMRTRHRPSTNIGRRNRTVAVQVDGVGRTRVAPC